MYVRGSDLRQPWRAVARLDHLNRMRMSRLPVWLWATAMVSAAPQKHGLASHKSNPPLAHTSSRLHSNSTTVAKRNSAGTHLSDLSRYGACLDSLDRYCPEVPGGAGLLAECLIDHVETSKNRGSTLKLPTACEDELHQFRGHAVQVGGLRALQR